MYKNNIRKTVLKRQRVGNEILLEALFHRQTVAHTQQNLTNYKINTRKKTDDSLYAHENLLSSCSQISELANFLQRYPICSLFKVYSEEGIWVSV